MVEAWLGPGSGWFTVYRMTMVEAWLGPGSGWFTVYNTTHGLNMDWSVLIWFTVYRMTHEWGMVGAWQRMVYSVPYDSWLRHGWGLAADSLHCLTHGWDTIVQLWYGLQCTIQYNHDCFVLIWFTVYRMTHGWGMVGAWQRMVYSVQLKVETL